MRTATRPCLYAGVLIAVFSIGARADYLVDITFNDPGAVYSAYYDQIATTMQAAANEWGSRIVSSGRMSLQVDFTKESTTSAGSQHYTQVGTQGDLRLFQQGALTTISAAGAVAVGLDAVLHIGADYLTQTLWFDPDPVSRETPIPYMKVDALSVFMHEFGHILFMNGWRDWTTGQLPSGADYESTFDQYVISDGEEFYFSGPLATALYGGPVPLTFGNLMHLGNDAPRPGSDLILGLMNGVVTYYQRRYYISDLDLAIAADTGIQLVSTSQSPEPLSVPEPASLAIVGVGVLIIGGCRWAGRRVA